MQMTCSFMFHIPVFWKEYQSHQLVHHLGSAMVCGCIRVLKAHFHYCDGSIDAEDVLERHLLPSRPHLSQEHPYSLQQDDVKPHSGNITKTLLRQTRVRLLDWPVCCPECWKSWKRNITMTAIMGKNNWNSSRLSIFKTSFRCCQKEWQPYEVVKTLLFQLFWDMFQVWNTKTDVY